MIEYILDWIIAILMLYGGWLPCLHAVVSYAEMTRNLLDANVTPVPRRVHRGWP